MDLSPFDSHFASLWRANRSLRAFEVIMARHERAFRLAGSEL